jgi:hypothetical protein
LEKNHIITAILVKGGTTTYALSQTMQENYQTFEKVLKKIDEQKNHQRTTRTPIFSVSF